jgi:hypothetical protein
MLRKTMALREGPAYGHALAAGSIRKEKVIESRPEL